LRKAICFWFWFSSSFKRLSVAPEPTDFQSVVV
jgi:hypothetical protein